MARLDLGTTLVQVAAELRRTWGFISKYE